MPDVFLYHAEHGARLFKEGEVLPTEKEGWYDSPAKCEPKPEPVEPVKRRKPKE